MDKWVGLIGILLLSILVIQGGGLFDSAGNKTTMNPPHFVTIPLGTSGGLQESDLSAFLLASYGSQAFIALDAGNLLSGIQATKRKGSFQDVQVPSDSDLKLEGWVLQNIKAYLLSHAHLDHVAGLVVNAPDDRGKPILGLDTTIDHLRDHLFNWKVWPNFGNEGDNPLNKYQYVRLTPGKEVSIEGTPMTVTPFVLSHSSPYQSTAFLIRSGERYTLFFGDTGPDKVEQSDHLKTVWTHVASLVKEKKLDAIFIEISFPNGHPDELLFGHLTPSWLMTELHQLAQLVDPNQPDQALRELSVIVTHIKPSFKQGLSPRQQIENQLKEINDLGVHVIFPEQGQRIEF